MNDTAMKAGADLAYMRALAEQGREAPLLGGRFHVWWGVWTAIAWLAHGATVAGIAPWPAQWLWLVWVGYGVIGGGVSSFLSRGVRHKPGTGAVGNVVERLVWPAAMGGAAAFIVGVLAAVAFVDAPRILTDLIVPVVFLGYGVALMMTGLLSGQAWLRAPALVHYAAAATTPFLVGQPILYLVAAIVVSVVGIAVGVALLSREPRAA